MAVARTEQLHAMTQKLLVAGVAFASLLPAQGPPPLLASTSRSFTTGDQDPANAYRPYEVALADFDRDGALDAALAHYGNFTAPKVSVMRNHGDGTFERPSYYPASGETMDVVAGDFDGDGDTDLAYAQSSEGTSGSAVLVYLNDGLGRFGAERRYVTGAGPTAIATADVDGDGDLDLATANFGFGAESVSVLLNNGTAVFAQRTDYRTLGNQPRRIALGDLTGDGRPELVASLRDGNPDLAVLVNNGQGGFGAASYLGAVPYVTDGGVVIADLDGDGDQDVLYGAMSSGSLSGIAMYRNQGQGQLAAPVAISTANSFGTVYDFAVGDVTGDGIVDILGTAQSSAYGYVLLRGTGNGSFGAPQVFRSGEMARAIATADLDGDGDRDVVVVNSGSLTLTVHQNVSGAFSLPPQVMVPAFSSQSDAGDFDGDGDLDLVTASGIVTMLSNDGTGTFTAGLVVSLGGSVTSPRLRELDGDGRADLLFLHNTLNIALADPFGGFGTRQQISLGGTMRQIDALDGDGDGDRDVVVAGASGGRGGVYYLQNLGAGAFAAPVFYAASSSSLETHVMSGDFDNDTRADLLTASGADVRVWISNGDGTFQPPITSSLGAGGVNYLTIGDFDRDGNLDAAASSFGSTFRGEVLTVVYGFGDGDFGAPSFFYGMFSLQYGGVGGLDRCDADGDGDLDIVGGAYGADDVEIFLNLGNRGFEPGHRYGVGGVVTGVRAADFTGDGVADVVANIGTEPPIGGAIAVLRNIAPKLTVANLGPALAGTRGEPRLGAVGTGLAGSPFALLLRRALPNAPLVFALGTTTVNLPLFGGTLVPSPQMMVPGNADSIGAAALSLPWPAGIPRGSDLFAQSWILDARGPQGLASSNGLRVTQR